MTPRKVLYFGHDATHTSVRRRMRQISEVTQLIGLTFRRNRYNQSFVPDWDNIDFGHVEDGNYAARVKAMAGAVRAVMRHRDRLRDADLAIARNLDMLGIALAARAAGVFKAPIVYDVFDVRGVLLGNSAQAVVMRNLERALIRQCALLVVTSPGFIEDYFDPILRYRGKSLFVENRVDLDILPDDPAVRAAWRAPGRTRPGPAEGRFVLGWVGALRCPRSAALLAAIAARLPWITVQISGKPTYCSTEELLANFKGLSNVDYTGEYWFPTGLYDVYQSIDLNWTYDLSKRGVSGRWLIPNRLYEGGYFGVPQLAETGSQTARYVERLGIGWSVPAELEAIIGFLEQVRADYAPVKARCVGLMDECFHYQGDIRAIFEAVEG